MSGSKRIAVVLFNLGGPDNLDAVKPFLFNLFYDPAIINLPNPFRYILAKFISSRRTQKASEIYKLMGGKSPIMEQTQLQVDALQNKLGDGYKVFCFMRYWKPFIHNVISEIKEYKPDEIVLLPLYPQFSTTTTASGFKFWADNAGDTFKNTPIKSICCYYDNESFIEAHANSILAVYKQANKKIKPRILFSAHGIPKNRVDAGDPYEFQIQKSVKKIVARLDIENLDYVVCYQSKVGPLKWLGPSTEEEITKASIAKIPLVITPIAFVSEHSETLVELDIEYKHLAENLGLREYYRVPAITSNEHYIECLKEQVVSSTRRKCDFSKCGQHKMA